MKGVCFIMMCEKCNAREATFFYSSNINGEKTERHLCADCAREEGFGGAMDYSAGDMFGSGMLGDGFGGMLRDFFAPERSLMSAFGSFGLPMRGIMTRRAAAPRADIVIGEPRRAETLEDSEMRIPRDAGADIRARRELAALRGQLEDAVKSEDFEKAAELRDKIAHIENGN